MKNKIQKKQHIIYAKVKKIHLSNGINNQKPYHFVILDSKTINLI